MRFNKHYELEGRHALLGASTYHWIRYSDDKFKEHLVNRKLAQLGTDLHAYAVEAIRLRIKQVKNGKTINMYINDAIGFRMATEQILFFSNNAFGTVDAISFNNNILRIYDLKTGVSKASFDQLLVYAAFFCLEYNVNPRKIDMIELRLYQSDDILIMSTEDDMSLIVETVQNIITTVKRFDKMVNDSVMEELS